MPPRTSLGPISHRKHQGTPLATAVSKRPFTGLCLAVLLVGLAVLLPVKTGESLHRPALDDSTV